MLAIEEATYYSRDRAERIADALNAGDPEWDYRVEEIGNAAGLVVINVYDENGDFVASATGWEG